MRDIAVTVVILGLLPFAIAKTHIAVLVWSWIGYMNPHRLAFGFAYNLPFAQLVAACTFLSLLFNRERKRIPISGLTVLWMVYLCWMLVTTFFALSPESAQPQLSKILKIQLFMFLTLMVMYTRERIHMLIWTIVVSIGFFSVKGGIFTLATAGGERVWGPPGSFIEDNNELALATIMIIPLMYYLRLHTQNAWVRFGLVLAMLLSVFSAIGSYSRGAVIAIACTAVFFWLKSSKKLVSGIAVIVIAPAIVLFMPQKWVERIETLRGDRADSMEIAQMQTRDGTGTVSPPIPSRDWLGYWPKDFSALGRINSWNYAINVANARLTGGGLESWSPETFALYAPVVEEVKAAHSIYFSVLADHGWPGLFMFLTILLLAWRTATRVIKASKTDAELAWAGDLARMMQVSFVAYCSGGAFLSLSYFDLPWHLIMITALLRALANERRQAAASQPDLMGFGQAYGAAPMQARPAPVR